MAKSYRQTRFKRQKKIKKIKKRHLTRILGRRQRIDSPTLRSIRDSLVELLGNTWTEVGWNLQTIGSPADVPSALKVWEHEERPHLMPKILLRRAESEETLWPSQCNAFGQKLDAMFRQTNQVGDLLTEAAERQHRSSAALDQGNLAVSRALLDLKNHPQETPERVAAQERGRLITEEHAKRKRTFELAKDAYSWLIQYRQDLEQALHDGYAYFARAELVRFRDSHRCRMNPWNVASAIAGLPSIGYRQSLKRCARFDRNERENRKKTAGLRYEIFLTIRRIIRSLPPGIGLVRHAEAWLQGRRPTESRAVEELQKYWYHLELSLEKLQAANIDLEEQPFIICSEYFRRVARRSPVDELLETAKRIQPVIKYRKKHKD